MTGVNKKGDSLCERLMKMVVSIIKLSSFSIAKMSLGGGAPGLQVPVRVVAPTENETPGRANPRNLYSQEPCGSAKNVSYLTEPDEGIGSSFMVRDWENIDSMASEFIDRIYRGNVDSMASDYIDRVHKKNQHSFR